MDPRLGKGASISRSFRPLYACILVRRRFQVSWCYRDMGRQEVWTIEANAAEFPGSLGAWAPLERIARPTKIKTPELLSGKFDPQDQRQFYETLKQNWKLKWKSIGFALRTRWQRRLPGCRRSSMSSSVSSGPENPQLAAYLNNLAWLYRDQREYLRAEPLLCQALAIQKKIIGENHPDYASSLGNLASLYRDQGDYPRAEPLYRQASGDLEEGLGENHPAYAGSLEHLAICIALKATIRRAEPLLPPGNGDPKESPGREPPRLCHAAWTIWPACIRTKATIRGPNRFSARHWRSERKSWARTIPIMPPA